MSRIFLVLSLLIATASNGQPDSTRSNVPETWKKLHLGLRAGGGVQKNFYTEFGLTLQRYIYEARHGFMVYTWYSTFEWTVASKGKEQVNAIKLGAELVNNGGAGGLEVKYLFNSQHEDVMITPKFGFGMGFLNLFYGYNFSTRKYPFPGIGKHQFSLAVNSNIFHHRLRDKKK